MATPSLPQPPAGKIQRIFTWQVTLDNTVESLPYRIQYGDVIYLKSVYKNPVRQGNIDPYNFVWASGGPIPSPGSNPYLLQPEQVGTNDPRIGCYAHVEVFMAVYRGLAAWDRQNWTGLTSWTDGSWSGAPLVLQANLPAETVTVPPNSEIVLIEDSVADVLPSKTGTPSFSIGPFVTADATVEKIWNYDYPNAPHSGAPSANTSAVDIWERRPATSSVPTSRVYSSPCQWTSGDSQTASWGFQSYERRLIKTSLKSTVGRPSLNALKSYGYIGRLTSPAKPAMRAVISHGAVLPLKTPLTDRRPIPALISYGVAPNLSSPYRPKIQELVSYGQAPDLRIDLAPYTTPIQALVSVGTANSLQVGATKVPLNSLYSLAYVPPLERTDVVLADQFFPGGFARVPIGGDKRPRPT